MTPQQQFQSSTIKFLFSSSANSLKKNTEQEQKSISAKTKLLDNALFI